jgi:hypothetical protein
MQATRSLPWCRGPKLELIRFCDGSKRDITFLEHFGGGLHANVFRAIIDDSEYAVKVVGTRAGREVGG